MDNKENTLNNFNKKTDSYLCTYFHNGAWWSLTIDAYNEEDAEARSKKLNLQLKGQLMAVIPAKLGFFAKLTCFIRNLLK